MINKIVITALSVICLAACDSPSPNTTYQALADDQSRAIAFLEVILKDTSESGFVQGENYVLSDAIDFLPAGPSESSEEVEQIAEALDEDEDLVEERLNNSYHLSLDPLADKGFTFVPVRKMERQRLTTDSLWQYVDQHYEHGFYSVSIPVFSSDYRKAFVKVGEFCGPECGGGENRVYLFKDDTWKLAEVTRVWVI